ncbi:ATP-dependent DNA ligase [Streptomyces sp. NPDC014805]|uniref:ATP-dependent DNA ligase n=1 Tax=Streptomyces sp. NPDC014805 TaxID=3364919 RepID=UPI0036F73AB3
MRHTRVWRTTASARCSSLAYTTPVRFPELVQAAADLPDGLVLDGELVVWTGEGMSFEALQRRAAAGHRSAPILAQELPAHLIAFDVLQADGRELLHAPYADAVPAWNSSSPTTICTRRGRGVPRRTTRRRGRNGSRPGPASPVWKGSSSGAPSSTTCAAPAPCTKFAATPPKPSSAPSPEACSTPDTHPGPLDDTGHLRLVGRSTPLRKDAARQLAERLTPAAPGHPWEGVRFTSSWGSTRTLDVPLVEPGLVAEIAVDTARERGAWRRPVRYARLRLDVTVADVPAFGQGALPAAG